MHERDRKGRNDQSPKYVGDAHAFLFSPDWDLAVQLKGELPRSSIPYSQLFQLKGAKLNECVVLNIPALLFGACAWQAVGGGPDLEKITQVGAMLMRAFRNSGSKLWELSAFPLDNKENVEMDVNLELRNLESGSLRQSYVHMEFKFNSAEREKARQRISRTISNMTGYCAIIGLQTAISEIIDINRETNPLNVILRDLPLPQSLSRNFEFQKVLPEELQYLIKSVYKRGLSRDLSLVRTDTYKTEYVVHVRIPCSNSTAGELSYYINESEAAKALNLDAHFVEGGKIDDERIEHLVDLLTAKFNATPGENLPINDPRDISHWHLVMSYNPKSEDGFRKLMGLVQLLEELKDFFLHGKM